MGILTGDNPFRKASTLRTIVRLATLPVRLPLTLAWRGYGLLWWAFDDESSLDKSRRAASPQGDAPPGAPPAGLTPGAPSAVTASARAASAPPPRRPRPEIALRVGFGASAVASVGAGVLSLAMVSGDALPAASGLLLWTLATGTASVVSVLLIRRRERRRAAEAARRAATPMGRAKARVGNAFHTCTTGVSACRAWVSSRGRAWSAKGAAGQPMSADSPVTEATPGEQVPGARRFAFTKANARRFVSRASSIARRGACVAGAAIRTNAASSRRVAGAVLGPAIAPMWSSLKSQFCGAGRAQRVTDAPTP